MTPEKLKGIGIGLVVALWFWITITVIQEVERAVSSWERCAETKK